MNNLGSGVISNKIYYYYNTKFVKGYTVLKRQTWHVYISLNEFSNNKFLPKNILVFKCFLAGIFYCKNYIYLGPPRIPPLTNKSSSIYYLRLALNNLI